MTQDFLCKQIAAILRTNATCFASTSSTYSINLMICIGICRRNSKRNLAQNWCATYRTFVKCCRKALLVEMVSTLRHVIARLAFVQANGAEIVRQCHRIVRARRRFVRSLHRSLRHVLQQAEKTNPKLGPYKANNKVKNKILCIQNSGPKLTQKNQQCKASKQSSFVCRVSKCCKKTTRILRYSA